MIDYNWIALPAKLKKRARTTCCGVCFIRTGIQHAHTAEGKVIFDGVFRIELSQAFCDFHGHFPVGSGSFG